jgi:hypothetical protein
MLVAHSSIDLRNLAEYPVYSSGVNLCLNPANSEYLSNASSAFFVMLIERS